MALFLLHILETNKFILEKLLLSIQQGFADLNSTNAPL